MLTTQELAELLGSGVTIRKDFLVGGYMVDCNDETIKRVTKDHFRIVIAELVEAAAEAASQNPDKYLKVRVELEMRPIASSRGRRK